VYVEIERATLLSDWQLVTYRVDRKPR